MLQSSVVLLFAVGSVELKSAVAMNLPHASIRAIMIFHLLPPALGLIARTSHSELTTA